MTSAAQQSQVPLALSIAGVCDLSKRTYFAQNVSGGQAFTFVNRPADVYKWELEVALTSGVLSWNTPVRWSGGFAPQNLASGKIHKFFFEVSQLDQSQIIGSYQQNF